jgi:TonB-dependent Receptor Plug Domain
MSRLLKSIFILSFLFLALLSNAQTNIENTDSLAGRFISDLRAGTTEKLMVQTNKNIFAAGEELWFKAYIINSLSHKYFSHSKTLYVDLVNEKDSAIAQLLLNIPSEKTEGFIRLKDSLPEGYYWLRLYTATIQKYDTNAILVSPIYVVNKKFPSTLISSTASIKETRTSTKAPHLFFYPEGGEIIAGTNASIAIKALDEYDHPVKVEGFINDNIDSSALTWFTTDSITGLGKISFFVSKAKNYAANFKWEKQFIKSPLPQVNHYASQISIKEQTPTTLKVVVSQGDSLYKKGKQSYLLGINKDSLCFASVGVDMYELSIAKSNFPAGISKLLLFNEAQEVVSERTIYISKPKEELLISTDKDNYAPRDKVVLTLYKGDSVLHPNFTALSVSVTDDSVVKQAIDLSGMGNTALWEPVKNYDELALLTQPMIFKGKNYSKESIANKVLIQKANLPVDTLFSNIKGRIINKKKLAVANRIVTLYANKRFSIFDTDTTNANGEFKFTIPPYLDSVAFTLQVSNLKGNKVDEKIVIDITSPFPKFSTPLSLKRKFTIDNIELVNNLRNTNFKDIYKGTGKEWLQSVFVKSSIKSNTYNTSKRVSNFSQILTGEAIQKINPIDASTAMLMIPGLHLRGSFLTLGGVTSFTLSAKDEPLLIVDGVMVAGGNGPQTDTNEGQSMDFPGSPVMAEMSKISPDIIDFVEVMKGPEAAYYGARGGNGVIIINTQRKSNFSSHYEQYGTLVYYPASYHLAPAYSMPDYSNLDIKKASFKDNRSTIYWNGHLYTSPNGKAQVEFYTGDVNTNYTISVTGITASGEIIQKKASIRRN